MQETRDDYSDSKRTGGARRALFEADACNRQELWVKDLKSDTFDDVYDWVCYTAEQEDVTVPQALINNIHNDQGFIATEDRLQVVKNLTYEKNDDEALQWCEKGNSSFRAKNFVSAINCYSEGIKYSTASSDNLFRCFGNRSAAYLHANGYRECLRDVQNALRHDHYPNKLKLLKRFRRAAEAIPCTLPTDLLVALSKADTCSSRAGSDDDVKETVNAVLEWYKQNRELCPTVPNNTSRIVSDAINVMSSKEYNRGLYAVRSVQAGECVILRDRPAVLTYAHKETADWCDYCHGSRRTGTDRYMTELSQAERINYPSSQNSSLLYTLNCLDCSLCALCSWECQEKAHRDNCDSRPHALNGPDPQINGREEFTARFDTCCMRSKLRKYSILSLQARHALQLFSQILSFRRTQDVGRTPHESESSNDNASTIDSSDTVTHETLVANRSTLSKSFISECTATAVLMNRVFGVDVDLFLTCMLRVKCNSIAFSPDPKYELERKSPSGLDITQLHISAPRVALGLYHMTSMINHSCIPNAILQLQRDEEFGVCASVYVTTPLSPGDQITICYGPQAGRNTFKERQDVLTSQYGFICRCRACKTDTSTFATKPSQYVCTAAVPYVQAFIRGENIPESARGCIKQPLHFDRSALKCAGCGEEYERSTYDTAATTVKNLHELANREDENLNLAIKYSKLESTLHKQFSVYYPISLSAGSICDDLARLAMEQRDLKSASRYCTLSTSIVGRVYGKTSIEYAHELLKLSSISNLSGDYAKCNASATEAISIFRVHGEVKYMEVIDELKCLLQDR
eukprot:CFRG4843T1